MILFYLPADKQTLLYETRATCRQMTLETVRKFMVPDSHGMGVKMVPGSAGGVRRRAAEAIKGRLEWMSRAAVIGCREFARRVALRAPGCLPARILDMFSAFEWDIPVGVA